VSASTAVSAESAAERPALPEERDPLLRILSGILGTPLSAGSVVEQLRALRLRRLARLMHYRIATLGEADEAASCLALLDQLSETAADQLLRSPALCENLRLSAEGGDLKDLLAAAHAADTGELLDAWSTMGDTWLGRNPPAGAPVVSREGRFFGPRLACGIPLDLSLPPAVAYPSSGLQRPYIPDGKETAAAVEHLDRAVEVLREVYPLGESILIGLSSNLVLRGDSARGKECWGASSGMAIGRIVVANPAIASSAAQLGEVLLHEATHCALDCAELDCSLLQLSGEVKPVAVPSPWTGSPLSPHALVHACVVWAVLLEYWACHRARHREDEAARARYGFIRAGFERIDLRALLGPIAGYLSDAAPRAVASACECAQEQIDREPQG
jgi:hypothetical protein